jgi:hypothetical protein
MSNEAQNGNVAKPMLGDRYFFVRWDLRILIRNENEKQKFKP